MICRVRIGFYDFDIPDDATALSFAKLAKEYIRENDNNKTIIEICLINEEDDNE